jgi:hypothetical protein
MWLGRPATTWQVTNLTKSVTPRWTPINTPLLVEIRTHTTFGDSTCRAPILSVVDRRSLVERVVRLRGPEGLPACRKPSSLLDHGNSVGILEDLTGFLGSSFLECGSSVEFLCILTESLHSSTLGEVGVPAYRYHSAAMPRIWEIYPS